MLSLSINDRLTNLQAWQQSVFCMALAEQNITHFTMFSQAIDSENAAIAENILQLFWEKMTVKGAKINFTIQEENFDAIIPESSDYDFYGVYPAVDYCVITQCIFNSFTTKSKEEALNASQTSFATIASFIELQTDQEIDEEELLQEPLFIEQLALQETLLNMLENERSPELIKSIRVHINALESTSIGISTL
ncbi:YjaG family protein [Psychromonas sp. 14N.309.X.WAT.B.A12]|uniref:YjaG family protein n=1 Tax=unclassified Psychromonas TaxID=2614957 RepID=UPI0025B245C1|nr:YjaG family protein [Psychromonas sp. 14N.309.X.WAT.B.A12]MDN2663351.1 YjaG family protein [Psychromonas sp. 14N.309.X.WAT.B.A12]